MHFYDVEKAAAKAAERCALVRRVYLCGNGGSAANATHIANDLISVDIAAHALTSDVATLTAIANDFGYEHVFARQLEVLHRPRDSSVLIALSGSGCSKNIIAAIKRAKQLGIQTWLVTGAFEVTKPGQDGTQISECVLSSGEDMQAAEEAQIRFGHFIMRYIKAKDERS
jgi:D-sedoheptulose 7-phosphate isomerase